MTHPTQLAPEDLIGIEVNRCYRSKIQYQPVKKDSEEEVKRKKALYEALANTHSVFNQKVADVARRIMAVLADKEKPEFSILTEWAIRNITPAGQCATHFANPFTLPDSRANPTHTAYNKTPDAKSGLPDMRELFRLCKERGDRWYVREEMFGSLIEGKGGSGLVMEVNQAAIEKISAYLKLKDLWRDGDFVPPELLDRETFIKTYSGFIKKSRDLFLDADTSGFDCLAELLGLKDAKLKGRLADIFSTQLAPEHAEILRTLGQAYKTYSDKALGKKAWLKQQQAFVKQNPEFLEQYQAVLKAYNRTLNINGKQENGETPKIPGAWYRDPNFLQMLEEEGRKGILGEAFFSPLDDAESQEEWQKMRVKNPDWPEWVDIKKISPHWDARLFYVKRMEALNKPLFAKDGWFGILKVYRSFEGKQYTEFRKPPALRFPDPVHHPEWLTLSDSGCFQYRNLTVLGNARVELTTNLINPNTSKFQAYTFQIKLDNRLKSLQPAQPYALPKGRWIKDLETGKRVFDWPPNEDGELPFEEALFYPWKEAKKNSNGEVQHISRLISIHGGNLIHHKKSFYLHFRYTYKAPLNQGIRDVENPDSKYAYKPGTRLLGFDLGQKADAVVAMMELTEAGDLAPYKFLPRHFKPKRLKPGEKAQKARPVYFQWLKLPGGNGFGAINHAEDIRRKRLSKMRRHEAHWRKEQISKGKTMPPRKVKGLFAARNQQTLKRLATYIQHCREQHCKQLAGMIVKIAEQNDCHGIVHENLENYRMSVKQRRFENRRLQIWIAQKTLDFLKTLCEAKGILCFPKSAAYTSQTCSQCQSWGVRFNVPNQKRWADLQKKYAKYAQMRKDPLPLVAKGGDWFLCSNITCTGKKEPANPNTRYMLQADANAAKNLLLRAFKKGIWGAPALDEKEKVRITDELQKWLTEVHAPGLKGKKTVSVHSAGN